ncbi:hypothetical protein HFC70_00725 [Agrobacterium sp. a22-2]|uniref:hypothetical protein n=1 Tax=Agrobacterium sp. a22-2 TaxID=2283840 RepID=UPI001444C88A|nr:hypothetical protein [Agrobacterium sp. a22-2]NKN34872.1 hypothetical protein [Agrobacterium sp. a22-2]
MNEDNKKSAATTATGAGAESDGEPGHQGHSPDHPPATRPSGKLKAEARNASALQVAEQRRLRAAQKLRENLMRRKQQSRARRSGDAIEGEGLPAANSPESDD